MISDPVPFRPMSLTNPYRHPDEPRGRKNLGCILGLLVVVAVLGVAVFMFMAALGDDYRGRIVPDVTGLDQAAALAALVEVDLVGVVVAEPSDEVEAGLVVRTEPEALAEVEELSSVTVFVSSG